MKEETLNKIVNMVMESIDNVDFEDMISGFGDSLGSYIEDRLEEKIPNKKVSDYSNEDFEEFEEFDNQRNRQIKESIETVWKKVKYMITQLQEFQLEVDREIDNAIKNK